MTARRGVFYQHSRSWYACYVPLSDGCVDDIWFSLEGIGSRGELAMTWHAIGKNICPRLEVFDDAWAMLAGMTDLIEELRKRDNQLITPQQFCELLVTLGFEDVTREVM